MPAFHKRHTWATSWGKKGVIVSSVTPGLKRS
jgi:hypothetical protein